MTEFLNLDELPTRAPERRIKLKGETHDMVPLSVGAFIEQSKTAKSLNNLDQAGQVEHTVRLIRNVFPSMKEETLKELSFDKLSAILDFITKTVNKEATESAEKNEQTAQ